MKAPLRGRFLADAEEVKKAQEEVAAQSKVRYTVDAQKDPVEN